jgi:hypothetical protein
MKNNPGQTQHDIPVRFTDGAEGLAVRTGNNAAWLCVCPRKQPGLVIQTRSRLIARPRSFNARSAGGDTVWSHRA